MAEGWRYLTNNKKSTISYLQQPSKHKVFHVNLMHKGLVSDNLSLNNETAHQEINKEGKTPELVVDFHNHV